MINGFEKAFFFFQLILPTKDLELIHIIQLLP